MSYIVAVWEQPRTLPLPGDMQSATSLMDLLYKVNPGPNPAFARFVATLTARFPDLGDCADGESVWTDGPLDGDGDEAILNLGLRGDRCAEVLPFLVETARAFGLSVYDMQACEVFFADGSGMGKHGRRTTEFETVLLDAMTPLLAAHGYLRGPHGVQFIREHADGWQGVSVTVNACWPPRFEFHLRPEFTYRPLNVLRTTIVYGEPQTYKESYSRGAEHAWQRRWLGRVAWPWISEDAMFSVRSISELRMTLPFVLRQVEAVLLPLLERCMTPAGLDTVLNTPDLRDSPFFLEDYFNGYERGFRNVLIGHLVDNPRLRAMCDEIDRALAREWDSSSLFQDTRLCIAHVRKQRGWEALVLDRSKREPPSGTGAVAIDGQTGAIHVARMRQGAK